MPGLVPDDESVLVIRMSVVYCFGGKGKGGGGGGGGLMEDFWYCNHLFLLHFV